MIFTHSIAENTNLLSIVRITGVDNFDGVTIGQMIDGVLKFNYDWRYYNYMVPHMYAWTIPKDKNVGMIQTYSNASLVFTIPDKYQYTFQLEIAPYRKPAVIIQEYCMAEYIPPDLIEIIKESKDAFEISLDDLNRDKATIKRAAVLSHKIRDELALRCVVY